MFDIFFPRNKVDGLSKGFNFVHYKTEWDAREAIHLMNGPLIEGNKISVQMEKYDGRKEIGSNHTLGRGNIPFHFRTRSSAKLHRVTTPQNLLADHSSVANDDISVLKEGSIIVVKVPVALTSLLKREVCDSFVATWACDMGMY